MSIKHAILGFISYQPMTGYDLKKTFDSSVRHFWPANQSQIYRTLAQLTEEGLLQQEVIDREDRLDMKVYHITEPGQQELQRWLAAPLPRQDFREPFFIQLYFGGKLSDAQAAVLLQREIAALEEEVAQLQAMADLYRQKEVPPQIQRAFFFSLLPLEYGLLSDRMTLAWLRDVQDRVQSGTYQPKNLDDHQENING